MKEEKIIIILDKINKVFRADIIIEYDSILQGYPFRGFKSKRKQKADKIFFFEVLQI